MNIGMENKIEKKNMLVFLLHFQSIVREITNVTCAGITNIPERVFVKLECR